MNGKDETIKQLRSELKDLKKQITLCKKAEKACISKQKELETSAAKFQFILKTTPARIINLDLNGNILFINHRTAKRSVKDVVGKNVYPLLSPMEQKKLKQILNKVIKTGKRYRYEPYIIHPNGETSWHENYVAPVKRNGKIVEFIISSTDITERKTAELELQKTHGELKKSEEKRLLFLKSAPERILNIDLNSKILYINHAKTLRTRDLIGTDAFQHVIPEERKKLKQIIKYVVQTGKKKKYEANYIGPDGKSYSFDCSATPIKINGKVAEIIIIAADITERRKAEQALQKAHDDMEQRVEERTNALTEANILMKQEIEERKRAVNALRESEEKLRSILDSSPDAIMVVDSEATIIECNQTTLDMLGYKSKDELLGKNATELILKKDHERALKNLGRTLDTGLVKNIEYTHVKKDGTEFPGEVSVSIIQDASGKLAGFVAITKDISVRKKAEEALIMSEAELRKQKVALEEKNIALREIIAQIEIEKRKIKEDIDINVDLLFAPILDQLRSNKDNQNYVNLLQHHLNGLTSAFGHKITDDELNLTPREIEICNMIKGAMTNKDIAKMLNISRQTVEQHRKNIRHKLGIANRRVNLTSYLRKM